jgi:hypothetical protein
MRDRSCSHQRLLPQSKSVRGAAPVFFGPCTLGRTWGTRPGKRALLFAQASIARLEIPAYGLSLLKTWSFEMSLNMTNAAKISSTTKAA